MADGYELQIEAELKDSEFQAELAKLVKTTQAQAAHMEKLLEISADLNTKKFQSEAAKLQAQKFKDKELDVDTSKAEAKIRAFETKEQANPIEKPVTADTSRATAQMLAFSRGVEQVTGRLGSIALLAGGVGTAIGAVGTGIAAFGLATASSLDKVQFAFERVMGGAQAAAPALDELKRAAVNTPFDLNDVVTLAFRMKAAGRQTKQLAGDVTTLADALAVTGGGAAELERLLVQIQQTKGLGRVDQRDLRAIANAVPSFNIGEFDKYVASAKKAGFKGGDALVEGIMIGLRTIPGAAGAAAAATEQTFTGRFSKFKDTIQIQFAEAFIPKKEVLFKGLDAISSAVGDFLEAFAPVGAEALGKLGFVLADLLKAATPVLVLFTEAFPKVLANFVPVVEKLSGAFEKLGLDSDKLAKIITGALVGGAILKLTGMLLGLVTPFLTAAASIQQMVTAAGGLAKLKTVFSALAGPVGLVVAALTLIVSTVATTEGAFASLASSAKKIWEQIQPGIKLIGSGLKDSFEGVMSIIRPFVTLTINGFKAIADSGVIQFIVTLIGGIVAAAGKATQAMGWLVENTIGRLPGMNKIFDKSIQDSEKAASQAMDRMAKKANERAEVVANAHRKTFEGLQDFLRSGLPALDTTNIETVKASGQKQLEAMKINLANLKTLSDNGHHDLIANALETGGTAGVFLMKKYAEAVRRNDQAAIDEFKNTLIEMQRIAKETEFIVRVTSEESTKTFLSNLFGRGDTSSYVPEYERAYENLIKSTSKQDRFERGKAINKFLEKYGKNLTEEEKEVFKGMAKADAMAAAILNKERDKLLERRAPTRPKTEKEKNETEPPVGTTPNVGVISGIPQLLASTITQIAPYIGKFLTLGDELRDKFIKGLGNFGLEVSTKVGEAALAINDFIVDMNRKSVEIFNSAVNMGLNIVAGLKSGVGSLGSTIGSALVKGLAFAWNNMAKAANKIIGLASSVASGLLGKFGFNFSNFSIPYLASGIQSFQGGLAVVGERGRELVSLPRGSQVYPSHKTESMMSKNSGSKEITVNQTINGVSYEDAVSKMSSASRRALRQVFA